MAGNRDRQKNPGRGAGSNPPNRFDKLYSEKKPEDSDLSQEEVVETRFFKDNPRKIINKVDSPDLGMMYSLNPYQGCEHGCIYCYARNTHEYWGWSAGLDFESRVVMKPDAPRLLRKHFQDPKWEPYPIAIAGNTDAYQPVEKQMEITRELLKVCETYQHPVSLITKNALILRDLDILASLAQNNLVKVHFSVTTLDENLRRTMEPRTAPAKKRLETIKELNNHGIPVNLLLAPVIPGLNDEEIPGILKSAAEKGARSASYTIVRLNGAVKTIFKDWLNQYFPDRANKVWHQIAACHGGQVNDSQWGRRIKGSGHFANMIQHLFEVNFNKYFAQKPEFAFNFKAFKGPGSQKQLDLFNG